ncbi:26976_t:CDS:2, partial [Gigaspora margarita]
MRHIDAYVCWFSSDFNDHKCILATDWKSDYNGEAAINNAVTPLLNPNNFPKGLNIHYNHAATKPGQDIFGANWADTNNPPRSEQVSFRLYMDKLYITSGTVKELQASFTTPRFLPTYNIAQREDESFIMTYNQQKENAGYTQEYNQGLQLLLQAMIPQPGERHQKENYWAMMQLFDKNISNEIAFWDALKRTYAYYKESSIGAILCKQIKATNYFNKNKEIQFSDKKGRNKPREWVVFNVHNRKYFVCGRKGYYIKDCPNKEKFKGFTHMYRKGKPKNKEEKHKNKYTKKTPGRKKDYTKDRPQNKTKKYSKEEKGDAFARLLAARAAKFEKDKKKAIKEDTKPQDTFGGGRYPRRSNTKYCKHCKTNTYTTEDYYSHQAKKVDEPMVFYAQKNNNDTGYQEYQEYQEYLKAKQAYLA